MIIKKAFTLTEVLVTALIASIVLTGVVSVIMISSRESDRAVAKFSGRTVSDVVFGIFTEAIRPARKIQVVSTSKLLVTDDSGTITSFEYDPSKFSVKKNGKTIYMPSLSKTENKIRSLTFKSGTPAEKAVWINVEVESKTQDHASVHSFNSQFYCRNN
ncbi:MAG: prepilin-type N-terminal cleavage/methylation domain-containing protein [Candidatus Delongbacteria bacterium]